MDNFYGTHTSYLREQVLEQSRPNEIHKIFLNHVGRTPKNSSILDIGTGNGYILSELEKEYPATYYLFGTDISFAMLRKCDSESCLASNYELPFGSAFFSTVTAKNVTQFCPFELARVLTDNGLFVFREYGVGKGLLEVAEIFPDRLIRSREPSYYKKILEDAGFIDISIEGFQFKKDYALDELFDVMQMYPFIKDFSEHDFEKIKSTYGGIEPISITSDPFILTAKRKPR
ncbi:MAG: class I SAM-dependent methyltransferase [Myxococcota bacterium]